MSRTIKQIYDAMITEKETFSSLNALVPNPDTAQTFLSDLTTSSKVAIWRLMFWVVAVAIWSHEQIFDQHKAELIEIGNNLITGTKRWYKEQALKFQYGDSLVWSATTLKFEYSPISSGTKIIKACSVRESNGQVRIKIAKDDGANGLEPLTNTEKNSFSSYMNQIKFAGTNINITNINADDLKLSMNIYYDPLVLTSTGESILNAGTFPVEDAINEHLKNLPFDGTFNITKFIDAIQSAEGVIDPELISSEAKNGANPHVATGQNYIASAGYLVIDGAYPLSSVINYIPVI